MGAPYIYIYIYIYIYDISSLRVNDGKTKLGWPRYWNNVHRSFIKIQKLIQNLLQEDRCISLSNK